MNLALQDGVVGWLKTAFAFLYDVALALGGPGLFLIAVADSSFLSLPEGNDLLIVILSTGQTWEVMGYYASMTILGSVTGCCLLFFVGRRGGRFLTRRVSEKRMRRAETAYRKWGIWSILVPSIMPPPTPFKIFVLWAGMFGVPLRKFIVAVLIGRSIRYYMWGVLAVLYGERARYFLENNLKLVGVILSVLLLGAILAVVLMRLRSREERREDLV